MQIKLKGRTVDINKSRPWGYPLISVMYVLVGLISVLVYLTLPFGILANLAIANICAIAIIFIVSTCFDNASVFDPFIGLAANVMVTGIAFWHEISFMNAMFMFLIASWSVRYVTNWSYNFRGLGCDRERNILVKEKTKEFYPMVSLLMLHVIPAMISYACVFPVALAIENDGKMTVGTFIFMFIALAALGFETLADIQMHRFKLRPDGIFNRKGMWKMSRHPNYLMEMIFWWAIAFAAVFTVGFKWYFFLGAQINVLWFVLVRVPIAELPLKLRDGWNEYSAEVPRYFSIKSFISLFERKPKPVEAPEEKADELVVLDASAIVDIAEALEQPDVALEDIDFVMDNDEELEEGTEVIGIVWPERSRRNKVYRYDPNGEKLEAGDIVLVPSRDMAKGRDIVRKVTVAHGNYKIDPESLAKPLKKIVAVVRRAGE